MSFNQTRDILDHARDFHRRLIRFYRSLRNSAANEITLRLIDDLVEHEQQLEHRLSDYEDGAALDTMDTFFKYMIATTDQTFENYLIPEQVDVEYVIKATRYFDEHLTRFYDGMAQRAMPGHVKEMLENLRQLEQREQVALSKLMVTLQEA
ncbi:hypothetical protein [Pontiella agarivorans]|uniref:Hemerythrin-like domain-containing protein n=1 Tax=Pontiella agarivorans TaxID=3038953 RepID=A0ABU5MX18_9BACT|nr:hypothetical protein [Pontiella agarivorans]MDZ8118743.1 hypothetical protein [Pontiella agarivorans]